MLILTKKFQHSDIFLSLSPYQLHYNHGDMINLSNYMLHEYRFLDTGCSHGSISVKSLVSSETASTRGFERAVMTIGSGKPAEE
jgi:hypothetical protein